NRRRNSPTPWSHSARAPTRSRCCAARKDCPNRFGFDPVRAAMWGSLGVAASSAWLALEVTTGVVAPRKILLASALWLVLGLIGVAAGAVGLKLAQLLEPRAPRLATYTKRARIPTRVILW